MSELLVRVVDKGGADIVQRCQLTQRGDVVIACPDGWPWSKEELSNPEWRILKIPELPLSEAMALCAPELPKDPQDMRRTLLSRKFRLDIDNAALPQSIKGYVADSKRANDALTVVDLTLAQVRGLKLTKTPVTDPRFV